MSTSFEWRLLAATAQRRRDCVIAHWNRSTFISFRVDRRRRKRKKKLKKSLDQQLWLRGIHQSRLSIFLFIFKSIFHLDSDGLRRSLRVEMSQYHLVACCCCMAGGGNVF